MTDQECQRLRDAGEGLFLAGRLMTGLSEPGLPPEHRAIVLAKIATLIEDGRAECERAGQYS